MLLRARGGGGGPGAFWGGGLGRLRPGGYFPAAGKSLALSQIGAAGRHCIRSVCSRLDTDEVFSL